jgi:glycosyltransferase involved in cell wall biosynthesis
MMGVPMTTPAAELRAEHRAAFQELFAGARKLIFPSAAARDRARLHLGFDLSRARVLPHGSDAVLDAERPPRGERLQVAIVGEVAFPIKGADNYLELLRLSAGLPVDWHFFGGTNAFGFDGQVKALPGLSVEFHGRYQREEISNLLARKGIDLCVLLPEADETFSFVLSEVVTAGVPVIANRKGALPERIETGGFGVVVDGAAAAHAALIELSKDRARLDALARAARDFRSASVAERTGELRQLYESLGFLKAAEKPMPFNAVALQELSTRRIVPEAPSPSQPPPPPPKYQGACGTRGSSR